MRKTAVPLTVWLLALAMVTLLSGMLVEPPEWLRWAAALSFSALLALTFLPRVQDAALIAIRGKAGLFFCLSALALVTALAGGGTHSLSVIALSLPLTLSFQWFGRDRTLIHAVGLLSVALVLDVFVVGRVLSLQAAYMSVLTIGTVYLLGARYSAAPAPRVVHGGSPTVNPAVSEALTTEIDSVGAPPLHAGASSPSAISSNGTNRNGNEASHAQRAADDSQPFSAVGHSLESVEDGPKHLESEQLAKPAPSGSRQWWRDGVENRVVADYLLDVRASTGADEAVVWLLNESDGMMRPLAASASNRVSMGSAMGQQLLSLVRWSCESGMVQCGQLEDGSGYVTAPMTMDARTLGVLCLRRPDAFSEVCELLKPRAVHHASHIARVVALVTQHGSSIARTAALDNALDAVRDLQDRAPVESPSSAICDAILHVCGCDASALVRWHPEVASGSVEAGAGAFESDEQSPVQSTSIVGDTCMRGTPFRTGATNDLLSRLQLFRKDERVGALGALSIQPMKRDGEVLGALVAAWSNPTQLTADTASSIEVLASVAAHALHAAWRLETVQEAARTDALTGLCNRRYLDEQLCRVLAESKRYGDPASLILLDLDYFKKINDTHGHAVGDMVLKHVAETLLDGVRGVDLCARYGGEELAVLLPRTGLQGAVELAERLRSLVESRPLRLNATETITVTASFGVATFPTQAPGPTELVSRADVALYRAKEAGRNRVRSAQAAY